MTKIREKSEKNREKCPPGSGELPGVLLETTPSVLKVLTSLTNEEVVVGSKPCPLYLLACYSRHLDSTTPGARPATL